MNVNDPTWSYGESKIFNSNGMITNPDNAWIYGQNDLLHYYIFRTPVWEFIAEHIGTHFIAEDVDTHSIADSMDTHFIAEP